MNPTDAPFAVPGITAEPVQQSESQDECGVLMRRIMENLSLYRFRYRNEGELHQGIMKALDLASISYQHEYRLSPESRLDFFCSLGLVLEVKVAARPSELIRQIHRYTEDERVRMVLIVSTCLVTGLPSSLNGKSISLFLLQGVL